MALTTKEKLIAIIANGIAAYSIRKERDELPANVAMYDFILKVFPDEVKSEVSAELIDEVFEYVSTTHNSSK